MGSQRGFKRISPGGKEMAGKRISANVPEQTHPEVTERANGSEPGDSGENTSVEDQRWFEDMAILRRAAAELAERRATARSSAPWLARDDSFYGFVDALGFSSEEHRNAAIRKLYDNNPERAASFFNMALRES